jgi:hypothetical protein
MKKELPSDKKPLGGKNRLTDEVAVPWLMWLVTGFPLWWPGFYPRSGHVGFVVGKVVPSQVFSEHCHFPCQFSFHQLLHIH